MQQAGRERNLILALLLETLLDPVARRARR